MRALPPLYWPLKITDQFKSKSGDMDAVVNAVCISDHAHHIGQLTVPYCYRRVGLSPSTMVQVAQRLMHVRVLDVIVNSNKDEQMMLPASLPLPPSLTSLSVHVFVTRSNFDDDDEEGSRGCAMRVHVIRGAAMLAHIQRVNIEQRFWRDVHHNDQNFVSVLDDLSRVSSLRSLTLRGMNRRWTDECMRVFRSMSHLETLFVHDWSDYVLQRLLSDPLPPECAWQNIGLVERASNACVAAMARVPNLRSVELSEPTCSVELFRALVIGHPHLQELYLRHGAFESVALFDALSTCTSPHSRLRVCRSSRICCHEHWRRWRT
jgi:hypothetical protein